MTTVGWRALSWRWNNDWTSFQRSFVSATEVAAIIEDAVMQMDY
jgi:hypothetical protein